MPGWRNWQTRRTQNPVLAREWEFDPPSGHQSSCSLRSAHDASPGSSHAKSVAMNLSEGGMNWAMSVTTTPYSGCHARKPLDMMWGLAYSSPEFAVEYL